MMNLNVGVEQENKDGLIEADIDQTQQEEQLDSVHQFLPDQTLGKSSDSNEKY